MLRRIGWSFATFAALIALLPALYWWYLPSRAVRERETHAVISASVSRPGVNHPQRAELLCSQPAFAELYGRASKFERSLPGTLVRDLAILLRGGPPLAPAPRLMQIELLHIQADEAPFDQHGQLPPYLTRTDDCIPSTAQTATAAGSGGIKIYSFSHVSFNHSATKALVFVRVNCDHCGGSAGFMESWFLYLEKRNGQWVPMWSRRHSIS